MARGRGADGEEQVLTGSKDPNPMSKPLVLWSLRAEGHGCVGPAVEGTVPSARIQSGAAGDGAPERSKWGRGGRSRAVTPLVPSRRAGQAFPCLRTRSDAARPWSTGRGLQS